MKKNVNYSMHTTGFTAIQAIQAILAPALGISAVGLLLLGLLNRYSNLITRIRLLTEERRKLTKVLIEKAGDLAYTDNVRYMSVRKQTDDLVARCALARNAILSLQASVAMFVLASLAIGLDLFVNVETLESVALVIFMAGMGGVLIGILFAAIEVYRSFKIVLIEVKAEE
ncbi:MAG: DUF2721 domain-containing protein [Bacteroidota bacterium]